MLLLLLLLLCPQNERGISPLGVAVGFNRKATVALLLDAGADMEAKDAAGNTVMHYAAGECVLTTQH
jgi:ankyrin repeat protein